MSFFKPETICAVLLAASIVPIGIHHACPRTLSLSPGNGWEVRGSSDTTVGGISVSNVTEIDSTFVLDYEIKDECAAPYVNMTLIRGDMESTDLSWMERIKVRLSSSTEDDYFRLHLRDLSTFQPLGDYNYNEALVQPTASSNVIEIAREDFYVPAWWIQQVHAPEDALQPRFGEIMTIEFTSVSRSGIGQLKVDSIEIEGSWIPASVLYPSLLALWISASISVLAARIWRLRHSLREQEVVQDKLKIQSQHLKAIALRDPLTGLLNRRGFQEPVFRAMEGLLSGDAISLVVFDIDRFKQLNDTMGHAHGDMVLRALARTVEAETLPGEIVARWGGEEFVILFPNTDIDQAALRAEQFRKRFAASPHGYTCSFGVYQAGATDDFATAMERADQALFDAKGDGRNKVVRYDSSDSITTLRLESSPTQLRRQPV